LCDLIQPAKRNDGRANLLGGFGIRAQRFAEKERANVHCSGSSKDAAGA
jgi:hypothetical protein